MIIRLLTAICLAAHPAFAYAPEAGLPPLVSAAVQQGFQDVFKSIRKTVASNGLAPRVEEKVRAAWRFQRMDGGPRRGDCVQALYALDDVLNMTEARRARKDCSWNSGLRAEWETLTPLRDGENVPETVDAVWRQGQLQRQSSGPADCRIYLETLDRLMDRLPVRNVQQTVFCQPGSSFVSVSFDYVALP